MFLTDEFNKNIPDNIKAALELCTKVADEKGLQVFLIGGIVRDIIIGQKNFDVDITVQGNAIEFAKMLAERFPEKCVVKETHESFKTAKVVCDIDGEKIALDVASTRKEVYPEPACLPVLEEIGCDLYEDVSRRDFSINSMALSLNSTNFCELVDHLGGYEDLKQGIIKILHPQSFIDDPTRIIRALKFSVRFGYEFDAETRRLMQECLDSGRFDNLAGERIKLELKQAFNVNKAECLERFIAEDFYRLVNTDLVKPMDSILVQKTVEEYAKYIETPENIWLVYLGTLLADFSKEKIQDLACKLYLSGDEESILLDAKKLCENISLIEKDTTRFEIYEFFEKSPLESILVFLATNKSLKQKGDLFLEELKNTKINSNGDTLIEMGLTPGPAFGKILRAVLKAKINNEITSHDQELELIKNNLKLNQQT